MKNCRALLKEWGTTLANSELREIDKYPVGIINIPPSKSISHRAVICAALAGCTSDEYIENLGESKDISATKKAIAQILSGDNSCDVDCEESGSTLRFLIPIAAMSDKEWHFVGKGRLMERPQSTYEEIFAEQGLCFEKTETGLKIAGPLKPGKYSLSGNISSQFITGLLFALSLSEEDSEISLTTSLESKGYIDLTIDVMRNFGVNISTHVDANGNTIGYTIKGGQKFTASHYSVEGDYSQAAFFLCAAALGKDVLLAGLNENSCQGDRQVIDILKQMGAEVKFVHDEVANLDVLSVCPPKGKLSATTIDAKDIPDIIPPLAALSCYASGTTHITNAGRLRIKESDRLHAIAVELAKLGASIVEEDESLTIHGTDKLKGGTVSAHNDHRIAMSMALASIGCTEKVLLEGSESVSKSYPNFWDDWEKKKKENI